MGDALLAEFPSVVSAADCALSIQEALATEERGSSEHPRIQYRIGVNVGDLIVKGDDLYGESINVAARLQSLAKPGTIAVSQSVRDHVVGRLAVEFEDYGEHVVKRANVQSESLR
ncbi:hypothetical protein AJ88_07920 [Mesorhizobium amorphae CCBAU 01583]|nr:hypothetical protein AJ88_07920 [Mesorhizobium amorphae CCBAU 01583]